MMLNFWLSIFLKNYGYYEYNLSQVFMYSINNMAIYSFHNKDCVLRNRVDTDKTRRIAPDGECIEQDLDSYQKSFHKKKYIISPIMDP